MDVRTAKSAPRHKRPVQARPSAAYTFSAPIGGWVLDEDLMTADRPVARILENWIVTTRSARLRGGISETRDLTDPVLSFMVYASDTDRMFAATATEVFDAESGVSQFDSLSGGDFISAQFGVAGGDYLVAVNGEDDLRLFNGTTWQAVDGSSSPIAITGVTTADLSHVWTFASRLWFVEKDTLSVWYLPAASIGGAATEFPLGPVFGQGGSIMFGARWSLDAGDGLDDKVVFVTTEGEVAVYEGSDPASDFRRVGLFRMPKPLGKRAYVQIAGDLLIATEAGLIPISEVVADNFSSIREKAISRPIERYWRSLALQGIPKSWVMTVSDDMGVLLVSVPATGLTTGDLLAVNLVTGGWSRITQWDAQAMAFYNGRTYIGSKNGSIYLTDEGGSDDGESIVATYLGTYASMGLLGQAKTILQMRPAFDANREVDAVISARADYDQSLPPPPSPMTIQGPSLWDVAKWDEDFWDGVDTGRNVSRWTSVGVTGSALAPLVMVSSTGDVKLTVDLIQVDAQFQVGAVVT